MDDTSEFQRATGALPRRLGDDVLNLIAWIALQPESEEEACALLIDAFARERGLKLPP